MLVSHYVVSRGRLAGNGRGGGLHAPPPPERGDGHERYVEEPGGRHLPPPPRHGSDVTEGRAPVAASTAEGSKGLASGSSGLVRWDLGMADHA